MPTHAQPSALSYLLPLLIVLPLLYFRLRKMMRPQPLKLNRLWIRPAVILFAGIAVLVGAPPPVADLPWFAVAAAIGAAGGWQWGRLMAIHVDPEHGTLMTRGSQAALVVIVLLLAVTLIAGLPVSGIIGERSDRQAEMQEELARSWSPEQTVRTPVLAVPYLAADGKTRGYLKIAPATLATQTALVPERKKRGLFSATVYTAALEMTGSFAVPSASSLEKLVGRGVIAAQLLDDFARLLA